MAEAYYSASQLAVSALNLDKAEKTKPIELKEGCRSGLCATCGIDLSITDLPGVQWKPFSGFTDQKRLIRSINTVSYQCTDCALMMTVDKLRLFQNSITTEDGIYPFAKNIDRAWFFHNPPAGQYVVTVSDAQVQHLIWRAPLNYSKKIMRIAFGKRDFTIVLDRLWQAYNAMETFMPQVHDVLNDVYKDRKKPFSFKYPWLSSDHEAFGREHGRIHPMVIKAVQANPALKETFEYLICLSSGEVWALSILLKVRDLELVKPEKRNY